MRLSRERDASRLFRSSSGSPGDDGGISGTHEQARLRPVARADVEVEIVEADRLAILAGLPLQLARTDDARKAPVACQDLDTLAEDDVRVEAAELADGDEPVVAGVGDDERDLVDVADDGEERPARGARDAHPRRAEHVGVHLAERGGLLAPHRGGELLLPRRPGGREQAPETVRNRHAAHINPTRAVYG